MSQETINILLATMTPLLLFVQFLLNKYFSRRKDKTEYSTELLKLANDATEALHKSREEQIATEEINEQTINAIRYEHETAIKSIRTEYDARHSRLKSRILDLENIQKIYKITFDLLTHPNVEIKNMSATAVDNPTAPPPVPPSDPPTPT